MPQLVRIAAYFAEVMLPQVSDQLGRMCETLPIGIYEVLIPADACPR